MRIALVHDYLNQYGGAERVLESFSEIFPEAPIFTLVYDSSVLEKMSLTGAEVYTSFLQKIPLAKSHHRFFPLLMPLAVEKFDLSKFDVVLSDSASFAKGVITRPDALHICYCHTPPRYAWDDSHKYIKEFSMPKLGKFFIPIFMNYLRIWDREASIRVDKFVCNSNFVAQRIKKYYHRQAKVIYPPVDVNNFGLGNRISNYFLMVGRILSYKRFDIGIKAFNKLGLPLKIIGSGPERKRLEKMAGPNIEFLGELYGNDLKKYYQNCQALIFPQEEDFGLVAVEAMACGKPVIAYKGGGILESVKPDITGLFFNEQSVDALVEAVKKFNPQDFNPSQIIGQAGKFNKEKFKKQIKNFINKSYENWN